MKAFIFFVTVGIVSLTTIERRVDAVPPVQEACVQLGSTCSATVTCCAGTCKRVNYDGTRYSWRCST